MIVDSFFGRVDTVPVSQLSAQQLLGGLPTILHERLPGDCGFVHSYVEDGLSFLKFRGKSVDANSLRPESGSYFARQSGALGNPKLKLFRLRHDFNYTYQRRQLENTSIRFLDHWVSGRANCSPHRFQPSTGTIRTTRALSIRTVCRNLTFPRTGTEGTSSDMCDRRRKGLRIASNAPPALSLSKVQNSTNSPPFSFTPRTNTGMASESRTQRRRSAAGCLAAVGPRPRRI